MDDRPEAVAFVAARSGAGKTTIISAIVPLLKAKGYRVGFVKHSGHEAAMDKEGSDTWRITRAGSEVTVLAARGQLAVMRAMVAPSLDDALQAASTGVDILLVEGFKDMNLPKIEVYRSAHSEDLYSRGDKDPDPFLIAVASDTHLDINIPVLNLNDPAKVCEFIIERFLVSRT